MKSIIFFGVLVVMSFFLPHIATANLVTDGDFSIGDPSNWEAVTGVWTVTDYEGMPAEYKNRWDLTSWQSILNGNFAWSERGYFRHIAAPVTAIPAGTGFSLSYDYAVAWEAHQPVDPVWPPTGYFYVYPMEGVGADHSPGRTLFYHEIQWGDFGVDKEVFTGNYYTENFIQLDHPIDSILFDIGIFVPNQRMDQIVALDNIELNVLPTPEPATLLLLGVGLAGLAGVRRKIIRS